MLTLESGRQVALVLRGHQDVGELGNVFAVVQVQVDDPEVAWLSPDEIVKRSELSGQWLHVVNHQEDNALQARATEMAMQKALDQLDVHPEVLGLPVGATRKQASESLIHWAIKEALLELGWLQAPELRLVAHARSKSGQVHSVPVLLAPVRLRISEVRAEVLFDGYRADIVCEAQDGSEISGHPWRLVVEVAVTNKVKPEKLRLIQAEDVACIELDVMGFATGGSVTRPQLRDLVANDIASKVWLHHPTAAGLLASAQEKANTARDAEDARLDQAAARQEQERIQTEARERQERDRSAAKIAWAQSLTREEAIRELRYLLQQRWAGKRTEYTSNGMQWEGDEFARAAQSLLPRLAQDRQLSSASGIAAKLDAVLRSAMPGGKQLDVKGVLGVGAGYMPFDVERWLGLLHLAIEACRSSVDDSAGYEAQRDEVLSSLAGGARTYARQTSLDDVLSAMFPEFKEVFSRDLGTMAFSERIRLEKEEAQRQAVEAAQLADAKVLEERAKQLAEEAAERERMRLPAAVAAVAFQWVWRKNLKIPPTDAIAISYLKVSKHRDASEEMRALVREGFLARKEGEDFGTWFGARAFTSPEEVTTAREVLEAAFLVQVKTTV